MDRLSICPTPPFRGVDLDLDKIRMIRLQPHALYSREDLIRMLKPLGIDANGWIARIRPRKRFRAAWWCEDLFAENGGR